MPVLAPFRAGCPLPYSEDTLTTARECQGRGLQGETCGEGACRRAGEVRSVGGTIGDSRRRLAYPALSAGPNPILKFFFGGSGGVRS